MEHHTKKSTRIAIIVIVVVMTAGFMGSYFIMILNPGQSQTNQSQQAQQKADQEAQKNQKYDDTAYKVEGKVDKLQITDLKVGTGPAATINDTLRVHYKGTIAQTGVKFDSSYDRGEPATFALMQVIQGWQEGIPGMQVNGKRRLVIPASLAYGDQAQGGIPANSDLVFEVELLALNPPQ